MSLVCTVANSAWSAAQLWSWAAFKRASSDPERAQRERLLSLLARNSRSDFGRRHRFAHIRSYSEFCRNVPICTWDDLKTPISRIAGGGSRVLTEERVNRLAWTSGSVAGAKTIPYTRGLLREFQRAIGPWIVELYRRRPQLVGGPAYWSVTPLVNQQEEKSSCVPVGFEEDTEYLGGWLKPVVDRVLAVPGHLRNERDVDRFRHLTLLHLLGAPELRLISVWHPSFLSLLLDGLADGWESLLRDVRDGLPGDRSPRLNRPRPERARQLERCGPDPLRLWPRLALVSCWDRGHAALGAREIADRLPGIELQGKGLIATEAFVSLPFGDAHPIAIRSHFFEFERHGGEICLAHELEEGDEVAVIVTTSGGLYRYRLGDRVRVDGFVGHTPSIHFAGRADARVDLRGEKLEESFVAAAIAELLQRHATRARFAMLVPENDPGGVPRYCLRIDAPDAPLDRLQPDMEALLRGNPHYFNCVRLGQLAPCRVEAVTDGYARYTATRQDSQRLGDIKPPALLVN